MVFSSLLFLFAFLPAALIVHAVGGRHFRNLTLLTASLFFYAWGEGASVILMALSILANYLFGVLLDTHQGKRSAKLVLGTGIAINLGVLFVFKYLNFLITTMPSPISLMSIAKRAEPSTV